jgi:hypothetical protein
VSDDAEHEHLEDLNDRDRARVQASYERLPRRKRHQ